jgi:hypothetical protein
MKLKPWRWEFEHEILASRILRGLPKEVGVPRMFQMINEMEKAKILEAMELYPKEFRKQSDFMRYVSHKTLRDKKILYGIDDPYIPTSKAIKGSDIQVDPIPATEPMKKLRKFKKHEAVKRWEHVNK